MNFKKIIIKRLSPKKLAEYYKKKNILNIGDGCEICSTASFGSEPYLIKIGNNVRITTGVKFITHDGGLWVLRNMGYGLNLDKVGPIIVGNNVFIGVDTIILGNVKIGNNVIVGCKSVVTKDIPDNCIVAGVPAKIICSIDEFYEKNKNKLFNTKKMSFEEKKNFYLNEFSELKK